MNFKHLALRLQIRSCKGNDMTDEENITSITAEKARGISQKHPKNNKPEDSIEIRAILASCYAAINKASEKGRYEIIVDVPDEISCWLPSKVVGELRRQGF